MNDVSPVISAVATSVGQALGLSPGVVQLLAFLLALGIPVLVRYLEKRTLVSKEVAAAIILGVEDSTPPRGAVRQAIQAASREAGVEGKVAALVEEVVGGSLPPAPLAPPAPH